MKFLIILGFVITINLSFAQTRKDTIHLKDSSEILCQILNISEPDSVIQFCIRENGELTVKKVHTSFVDSYSWPGKNQAVKYSRMLGVKNIQSGEAYKDYWLAGPPAPKQTDSNTDPIALEIKKAKTLGTISFAAIGAGLATAFLVPKLIRPPGVNVRNNHIFLEDPKKYDNTIKALQIAGYGIIIAGVATGVASLNHLAVANKLKKDALSGISLSVTGDGLSLAFSF